MKGIHCIRNKWKLLWRTSFTSILNFFSFIILWFWSKTKKLQTFLSQRFCICWWHWQHGADAKKPKAGSGGEQINHCLYLYNLYLYYNIWRQIPNNFSDIEELCECCCHCCCCFCCYFFSSLLISLSLLFFLVS